jgi:hypothetical protein
MQCSNLRKLTLHLVGDGPVEDLLKYMIHPLLLSVTTLSLRVIPVKDYGPWSYDSNVYLTVPNPVAIELWPFVLLKDFSQLNTLRFIVEPGHIFETSQLLINIGVTTQHLQLTTLDTNLFPDIVIHSELVRRLFPVLERMILGRTCCVSDRRNCSRFQSHPSPYRGSRVSREIVSHFMGFDNAQSWRLEIPGSHFIMYADDEDMTSLEHQSFVNNNGLKPYCDWLERHGKKLLIQCYNIDLEPISSYHSLIDCGHPDIFLDLRCPYPHGYSKAQVQNFITKIVPTTRSLVVNTFLSTHRSNCHRCPNNFQSLGLHDFFNQVVEKVPLFQLEHL